MSIFGNRTAIYFQPSKNIYNEVNILLLTYIAISIWNLTVTLMYGLDKYFSKAKMRRISEKALILPAFLLGSIGAMLGMILFNHKTSKIKFRLMIPLAFIINIIVFVYNSEFTNLFGV